MIVSCTGTRAIASITEQTNFFEDLRRQYPSLTVFSIYCGDNGTHINGQRIKRRAEFMARMKAMKDHEDAIILHYDILSEGIDVPGITGIMPLRPLRLGTFLQTLGRAARLHRKDFENNALITESTEDREWSDGYIKPYSWVIIPSYGPLGIDISTSAQEYITLLREFGWTPEEDVFVSVAGALDIPEQLGSLNDEQLKKKGLVDISTLVFDIMHQIEEEERTAMNRRVQQITMVDIDIRSDLDIADVLGF